MRRRDALIELAAAVSDRRHVDWQSAEQEVGAGARGLHTLARLAAAFDEVAGDGEVDGGAAAASLFTWGHLAALELIGEGQFGKVYRAHDCQLGREVALKLARGDVPRRGLAEARRLARVRHPGVLTVHGAAIHDGRAGIWTDLIDGQTLEERLGKEGPLGAGELRLVGVELCGALAAVHAAGLVHGDVKASNVVRERGGRLVLVDFGAAHLAGEEASAVLQATPSYLAPEVSSGRSAPTVASDLYAVGCVLYRLASGHSWRGGEAMSLRDARPELPPALVQAIEKLLAEQPERRPRSAGDAERLLAAGEHRAAKPRLRLGLVVAALSILALALAGRWFSMPAGRPSAPAPVGADLWLERDGESFAASTGDRLRPGDLISLQLELAGPTHLYLLNEDDAGDLFVLFPLPGIEPKNPLPRGAYQLPGLLAGQAQRWQVTSAGGRERFLLIGSPEPLAEAERFIAAHPPAGPGAGRRPDEQGPGREPSPVSEIEDPRGVGGLAERRPLAAGSRLAELEAGLAGRMPVVWTRFWVFENPR